MSLIVTALIGILLAEPLLILIVFLHEWNHKRAADKHGIELEYDFDWTILLGRGHAEFVEPQRFEALEREDKRDIRLSGVKVEGGVILLTLISGYLVWLFNIQVLVGSVLWLLVNRSMVVGMSMWKGDVRKAVTFNSE